MHTTLHALYVVSEPSDDVVPRLRDGGLSADGAVTVDVVRTTAGCLATLGSEDVDCIVIESVLNSTCVELCSRVRARSPSVPIVVFPADGSEALAGEVIAAGANGYVARPQGIETLTRRIRELIDADDSEDTGNFDETDDLDDTDDTDDLSGTDETDGLNGAASSDADGSIHADGVGTGTPAVADRADRVTEPETETETETEDAHRRLTGLDALQETTHRLLRAESTDEIAEIVAVATEHVVDRPLAAVRFADEDGDVLEPAATTPALDDHTDRCGIDCLDRDAPICWDAYVTGEPTIVENATGFDESAVLEHAVGRVVIHPLGEHGLLSVGSTAPDEFDSVAVHLVHVLAGTAAAALDRAARDRDLERAEAIVETVGDSVYSLDRDGNFVTVNDTMTEVTGYDREALVGEHISTVLTDESVERRRKRLRALSSASAGATQREDAVAAYEVTIETRDGVRIPCEINTALTSTDGKLDGTVGIVRDISDRKRMQRELFAHEAKIESLHEIASRLDDCETRQAIYDLTVEAAEDVLNFDVCVVDIVEDDRLIKKALSSELDAEYARSMSIDEGIAGKTYRTGRTYRVPDVARDADAAPESDQFRSVLSVPIGGRGVFQAVSTEPAAFDDDDEDLAELLLSHVADALDRIAFEEEIRAERDRFAALFENVPDAVVSTYHAEDVPIVENVNPSFERIFGYEAADVIGEPLDEFIVPADSVDEASEINRRGSRGDVVETEVKRRAADGLRDFMTRVVPVESDDDLDRTVGLYTDITEQKRQRKRLEILNRVLRHDLRNGMNIINGCAEVLEDAVDDGAAEYATMIRDRADELIGLAEKTRAVERTLDRDEAMSRPTDAAAAVRGAIDRLERTYDVAVDRSLPDQCYVHASTYLETAIFQVLENAVEHSDGCEPTITTQLSVDPEDETDTASLSIADDGPGIPEEERELLQEDQEITQLRHASGLGLWLVNWVVTQSGGQLQFAENRPRGTVVDISLPLADAESVPRGVDEAATSD